MQGTGRSSPASLVDWSRIRERLADMAAQEAQGSAAVEDIFAARARALSRPLGATGTQEGTPWLYFRLGRERYAIAAAWVVAVGRIGDLAPVPGTPPLLMGVANMRGQLLPVFDLRQLFGVQASGIADMGRLLLLGRQGRAEIGVLADEVEGQGPAIQADADSPAAPGDPCLGGITADGTLMINGQALLADARLLMEDPA